MSASAPARFHGLTDQEITALHEYLKARAQQPSWGRAPSWLSNLPKLKRL
jgi:hypothetical protein